MVDPRHAVIMALILVTVLHFSYAPRYEVDPIELIANGDFRNGLEGWKQPSNGGNRIEESGVVILENSDPSRNVFLRQYLPVSNASLLVKLTGEVWTDGIVEGESDWHKARLSLVAKDKTGEMLWDYPHQMDIPQNTEDWHLVSKVFKIPSEAVEMVVGMEILRASGQMRVRHISLSPVKEYFWFSITAYFLLFVWGMAFLWIGRSLFPLFNSKMNKGSLLGAFTLIVVGVMMPSWMKEMILTKVENGYTSIIVFLSDVLPGSVAQLNIETAPPIPADKFGHFFLFAFLAFLCRRAIPHASFQTCLVNLMLFATTTEVLQFFIFGRSPKVQDWMVDFGGLLCGLALSEGFQRMKSRS